MIEPWLVGRENSITSCNDFKQNVIGPDWTYCKANGMDYAPVMFPGFAWGDITARRNEIPRLHGDFMWQQAYNIRTLAIPSAYIAMFDECNEGTAMLKAAENASMLPTNRYFLPLDVDGTACSSDFYLRLAGDMTRMIKGVAPAVATHPTPHLKPVNIVSGKGMQLSAKTQQTYTIRIFDIRGRKIRDEALNSLPILKDCAQGVYCATLFQNSRPVKSSAILINQAR
jgi:hypothetical protein